MAGRLFVDLFLGRRTDTSDVGKTARRLGFFETVEDVVYLMRKVEYLRGLKKAYVEMRGVAGGVDEEEGTVLRAMFGLTVFRDKCGSAYEALKRKVDTGVIELSPHKIGKYQLAILDKAASKTLLDLLLVQCNMSHGASIADVPDPLHPVEAPSVPNPLPVPPSTPSLPAPALVPAPRSVFTSASIADARVPLRPVAPPAGPSAPNPALPAPSPAPSPFGVPRHEENRPPRPFSFAAPEDPRTVLPYHPRHPGRASADSGVGPQRRASAVFAPKLTLNLRAPIGSKRTYEDVRRAPERPAKLPALGAGLADARAEALSLAKRIKIDVNQLCNLLTAMKGRAPSPGVGL